MMNILPKCPKCNSENIGRNKTDGIYHAICKIKISQFVKYEFSVTQRHQGFHGLFREFYLGYKEKAGHPENVTYRIDMLYKVFS